MTFRRLVGCSNHWATKHSWWAGSYTLQGSCMTCILHTARISNVGRSMVNFKLCAESHRFNLGTHIFSLSHARDMLITSFLISSPKLKKLPSFFICHTYMYSKFETRWVWGEKNQTKTTELLHYLICFKISSAFFSSSVRTWKLSSTFLSPALSFDDFPLHALDIE